MLVLRLLAIVGLFALSVIPFAIAGDNDLTKEAVGTIESDEMEDVEEEEDHENTD